MQLGPLRELGYIFPQSQDFLLVLALVITSSMFGHHNGRTHSTKDNSFLFSVQDFVQYSWVCFFCKFMAVGTAGTHRGSWQHVKTNSTAKWVETSQLIVVAVSYRGTEIVWERQLCALMYLTLQKKCWTTSMDILLIKERARKLARGSLIAGFIATLVSHTTG